MAKDLKKALKKTNDEVEEENDKQNQPKPPKPVPQKQQQVVTPTEGPPPLNQPDQIIVPCEPKWDDVPDFDLLEMLAELENNPPNNQN